MCVRLAAICKAALYLLSHWMQIKAFHSNSLSGNRGTGHFIYNSSYAAAGAKWFIKGLRPKEEQKTCHFLVTLWPCAIVYFPTTCHSITACITPHLCPFSMEQNDFAEVKLASIQRMTCTFSELCWECYWKMIWSTIKKGKTVIPHTEDY